jgi:hypothetical protein
MTETLNKKIIDDGRTEEDEGVVALIRNRNDRIKDAGVVGAIASLIL